MNRMRPYCDRIIQVYRYIQENLEGDNSINRLSEEACMSPYHFHRIYRSWVGETLNASVRRSRLTMAEALLPDAELSIAQIARRTGYQRVDSFSRAFQRHYKRSPNAYRDMRLTEIGAFNGLATIRTPQETTATSVEQPFVDAYTACLSELGGTKLITLNQPNLSNSIELKFVELYVIAQKFGLVGSHTRFLGLYRGNHYVDETCLQNSEAALVITDAQFEALEDENIYPCTLRTVPRRQYLRIVHRGSYLRLENAYRWASEYWMPEHHATLARSPIIELYLNDPRITAPGDLRTEILFPLR